MSTKQRIVEEALNLFSTKGFHSVTVEDIAKAVGIKAPSLYKHYKNKQCIFNAILDEMQSRYFQQMEQIKMNGVNPESDSAMFQSMSEKQVLEIGRVLFSYYLHDEYNRKFRKMLTVEQFQNKSIGALYVKQYFDDPIHFLETIFSSMTAQKHRKKYDPKIIALHFYSPVYFLLALCDAQQERESEAFALLEKHIKQFNRIYNLGEEKDD